MKSGFFSFGVGSGVKFKLGSFGGVKSGERRIYQVTLSEDLKRDYVSFETP